MFYFFYQFLDDLDGCVAREYNKTSKFGKYFDSVGDMIVGIVILLALINKCTDKTADLLIAFVMFKLIRLYMRSYEERVFTSLPRNLSRFKLIQFLVMMSICASPVAIFKDSKITKFTKSVLGKK